MIYFGVFKYYVQCSKLGTNNFEIVKTVGDHNQLKSTTKYINPKLKMPLLKWHCILGISMIFNHLQDYRLKSFDKKDLSKELIIKD